MYLAYVIMLIISRHEAKSIINFDHNLRIVSPLNDFVKCVMSLKFKMSLSYAVMVIYI